VFLYKYLTPEKTSDWLIKENSLMLTPPIYLNDVLEFRVRREPDDAAEVREMFSRFQQEIPTNLTLKEYAASVGSAKFRLEEPEDMQRRLSEKMGVLSLTSDPLNELMWAHYGHNTGVAIGYSADEETERQSITARLSILGVALKVGYTDTATVLKKDFSNALHLLTRKRECWGYENEWRIVRPLAEARIVPREEKTFYALPVEREHISHLVFGVNAKPEFQSEMRAWLGETSAKIQVVIIDPETNSFSLGDIPM
jgi:hypothetical protein